MKRAMINIATKEIVQVVPHGGEFPIHPDYAWQDCPDECVAYAWGYDGAAFSPPAPLPLATIKAAKRKAINKARDAEEEAGFDYLGKRFDSDAQAIKRLYGAAMAAQAAMAGGVSGGDAMVTWTCADGSTIDLTYAQMATIPLAMAQVSGALHIKARALKTQADIAVDQAAIEAVVW